jgi:integrase
MTTSKLPNKFRLTKTVVAALPAPAKGIAVYWDNDERTPGLGLRIMPSGRRVFFLQCRTKVGRGVKITLGNAALITPDQAREAARKALATVELGGDPAADRKAARRAQEEKTAEPTLAAAWATLERDHLPTLRDHTRRSYSQAWRLCVAGTALARAKLSTITRTDIERLHRAATVEHGPYSANRMLGMLSVLFVREGADNPCRGVKKHHEEGRERYLTTVELERVLRHLGDDAASKAIEFLLLTGARRGEVLSMCWRDFNADTSEWVKPSATTKDKLRHRVPLSPEAVALLDSLPHHGDRVFLTNRKLLWQRWDAIRAAAGVPDVRLHDLRHSYASFLISGGASLPVIGRLLGHARPQTTARYAHVADQVAREATGTVGKLVRRENVVPLRRAQ